MPNQTDAQRRARAIIAVGAVVHRRRGRRVELLLIRKRGGFWTLPKGKLRPGETHVDALQRELAEETGITGEVEGEVLSVAYMTPRRHTPRRKFVTYYLVRAAADARARPGMDAEAIERVRWATPSAALRRIRRARVKQVVEVAAALLSLQQNMEPT